MTCVGAERAARSTIRDKPVRSLQRMVELSRCAAMRFMARNPLGSRGRLTAWANGIGWPVHEKAQVPVPSFPAIP